MKLYFRRDFARFSGGHLKVWDYFCHTRASLSHEPRIYFTEDSVWDETNPWRASRDLALEKWPPPGSDPVFLAGNDWLSLPEPLRRRPGRPILNLIQHVRHADPEDPRFAFLPLPALRICVSEQVTEAVTATGLANGPVLTIPNGIDLDEMPGGLSWEQRDTDILVLGIKKPRRARRTMRRLRIPLWGRSPLAIREILEPLPRERFLAELARTRVLLCLPDDTEGFYLPALEAMAVGCLVVCPDCVGNRSFCVADRTAFVPPYQPAALARAARAALALPAAHRERLRETARRQAERHDLHSEREAFQNVLESI